MSKKKNPPDLINVLEPSLNSTRMRKSRGGKGKLRTVGVEDGGFKGHLGREMWIFGRESEMSAKESTCEGN